MKRFLIFLLSALLLLSLLAGCGSVGPEHGDKFRVVVTIFPPYDWVAEILGDRIEDVELTLLLDNGADLHSYQPTADDMIKVSTCDLFVYVGGTSDGWVKDALKEAVNPEMRVVNLMEALGDRVVEEERVEGMEPEEDHDHGEEDHDHEEEGPEYDEHIWLSLKNAAFLTRRLSDEIQAMDPENAGTYKKNTEAYLAKLDALDASYADMVAGAEKDTLLFGDRFPFRYLAEDYGLNYYAAFVGCSAETEASFETVIFLANKLEELELPAVLAIESSDGRLPRTILENAKSSHAQVMVLNSLQSVTAKDVAEGASYLSIMEDNLETLRKALG